jgi:hypothetical protein
VRVGKPQAKRVATRRATITSAPADARIRKLIDAFRADPVLAPAVAAFEAPSGAPRRFGSNGLKVNGKLFALFTRGTLVLKLPKARVATLIAEGRGKPFEPSPGRAMKEWLVVASAPPSSIELAKEAHAFVATATRAGPVTRRR